MKHPNGRVGAAADEQQLLCAIALRSSTRKRILSAMTAVAVAVLPCLAEMRDTQMTVRHVADWLGWLGAGMLSSSLLLMVREPILVSWFGGLERMYRWHHAIGILACIVLLAHPVMLAITALPNIHRALSLLSPARWYPANALGWVALGGLVGVSVSLWWRVRYATWRRLHLLMSLAVLLWIAHAYAYRGFTAGFLLAGVPGVLALGWRVVRADRGFGARPYEVQSSSRIASKTTEIVLMPLAAPVAVQPGQFVMVAFFEGPHYRGCGEFHPYTICDSRADGSLVLAVKALGDCTTQIQSLERGVAARVQGPYGDFLAETSRSASLWIAGGIGITPFVARLRAGSVQAPTELIYTYRSSDAAAYLRELQEHADHQPLLTLRTLIVQEDATPVVALLDDVRDLKSRHVYVSGPPSFIHALVQELDRRGISRSHIHYEEFEFRSFPT